MSTNENKPRRTFDQDVIDGAVKLVTLEGYSLAAAAKAMNVPYSTLRHWCQKQEGQGAPTTEKTRLAIRQAIQRRRPSAETRPHHSNRGGQYTSEAFQDLLRTLLIICSTSRTGCWYDNAVPGRIFRSLKRDL
jgi:transposase